MKKFREYWVENFKQSKDGFDISMLVLAGVSFVVFIICKAGHFSNPIEEFITDAQLERWGIIAAGVFFVVWCFVCLPFKRHERQAKEFEAKQKELDARLEKSLAEELQNKTALEAEVSRLNKIIQDESPKLQIDPITNIETPAKRFIVKVKVVNKGKVPVTIEKVYLNQKTSVYVDIIPMTRTQPPELILPQQSKPMRLEAHGGAYTFQITIEKYTGILAYASEDGKRGRIGKGIVLMTDGEECPFTFPIEENFPA